MPSPVSGTCEEETGKLTFPLPNSHTCRHTPAFSSNLIAFFQKWPHWLVCPRQISACDWRTGWIWVMASSEQFLKCWLFDQKNAWSFEVSGTGVCFCFLLTKQNENQTSWVFPAQPTIVDLSLELLEVKLLCLLLEFWFPYPLSWGHFAYVWEKDSPWGTQRRHSG